MNVGVFVMIILQVKLYNLYRIKINEREWIKALNAPRISVTALLVQTDPATVEFVAVIQVMSTLITFV